LATDALTNAATEAWTVVTNNLMTEWAGRKNDRDFVYHTSSADSQKIIVCRKL